MTDAEYTELLKEGRTENPSFGGTPQDVIDLLHRRRHSLNLDLQSATGQLKRAREIADECGRALRRCCDDSKDFRDGKQPNKAWVQSNIDFAEKSLDLFEQREWD